MASRQVPSIGRIVHYWGRGLQGPYPAIVTEVYEPANPGSPLSLTVFSPRQTYRATHVYPTSDHASPGWNWPPHVPPVEMPAKEESE